MDESKVGLLLPLSYVRPLLTKELFIGIKGAYQDFNIEAKFFKESIGLAASSKEVIEKAQNLLVFEDVDVIYTMVGKTIIPELIELIKQHKKQLVLLDAGLNPENVVDIIEQNADFVQCINFSLSDLSWQLGLYTALNIGKRVLISSDFIHSGYSFTAAFEDGLKQENGEICGFHIVQDNSEEIEKAGAEAFRIARETGANAIFANYVDINIGSLLKASQLEENKDIAIITHSLCLPIESDLSSPNLYAGFIKHYLDVKEKHQLNSLVEALAYTNAAFHVQKNTTNPISEIRIQKGWNTSTKETSIDIPLEEKHIENYHSENNTNSISSGWTNPYLCV